MKIIFQQRTLILSFILSIILLTATAALAQTGAQTVINGLQVTAGTAKLDTTRTDLPTILGQAINYIFGVVGTIFMIIILVGGYLWMTAGGSEEKVAKAKGFIINGINGMIVIFLAYALVYTILFSLKGSNGAN